MSDWLVVPNQIINGNSESHIAIITGWTFRDTIKRKLEEKDPEIMEKVAGIGQLYTASRGIDMLVRNLLSRPTITEIFCLGTDLSGSIDALVQLFAGDRALIKDRDEGGEYWGMRGTEMKIRVDIPLEVLMNLRKRVRIWTVADHPVEEVIAAITLKNAERGVYNIPSPVNYSPMRPDPRTFPHPTNAHIVRATDIPTAYLEMLHRIMTFGHGRQTHYDQNSLELCNLMIVVTDQGPTPLMGLPEFIPFDVEHLTNYFREITSFDPPPEGVSYRYGHQMRKYFGVDQFVKVAEKLAKDPSSRSAVISLWDPAWDRKHSPCLNHMWFRIINERLHLTATIRSNDMLQGWPENAYGLRFIQSYMRELILKYADNFDDHPDLLPLGDLVTNSQSAHLYEDEWAIAKELVAKYRRWKPWWDEGCEWIIADHPSGASASYAAPGGTVLGTQIASGNNVRKWIAKNGFITDISHALWIGYQLGRLDGGKNNAE